MTDFSHKAFAAFTLALAASAWALFSEVGKPFLPSVPIVVYAVFVYANRDAVATGGSSDTLKDSPYFLGFLLTMFGLYKLFDDVSFNFALFGRNPQLLTQEVGGAVLSTIVGLFSRQALLSLIADAPPEEEDRLAQLTAAVTSHAVAFEVARQQFFREMADEQERRARALEASQRRLVVELAERLGAGASVPSTPSALLPAAVPVTLADEGRAPGPAVPHGTPPMTDREVDTLVAPVLRRGPTRQERAATDTPPGECERTASAPHMGGRVDVPSGGGIDSEAAAAQAPRATRAPDGSESEHPASADASLIDALKLSPGAPSPADVAGSLTEGAELAAESGVLAGAAEASVLRNGDAMNAAEHDAEHDVEPAPAVLPRATAEAGDIGTEPEAEPRTATHPCAEAASSSDPTAEHEEAQLPPPVRLPPIELLPVLSLHVAASVAARGAGVRPQEALAPAAPDGPPPRPLPPPPSGTPLRALASRATRRTVPPPVAGPVRRRPLPPVSRSGDGARSEPARGRSDVAWTGDADAQADPHPSA